MKRSVCFAAAFLLLFLPPLLFAQAGAARDPLSRRFSELLKETAQARAGDLRVDIRDVVFTTDGTLTHLVVNLAAEGQGGAAALSGQEQPADAGSEAGQGGAPGYDTSPSEGQAAAAAEGPERHLVPVERFTFGTAEQAIVIDLDRGELQGLPTLSDGRLPSGLGEGGGGAQHLLASSVRDYEVFGREGRNLGAIDDLMLDLEGGKVAYLALATGGFLGIGEELFAVPLSAVSRLDTAQQNLTLDIGEEQLKAADGFDPGNWPAEAAIWAAPAER